MLLNFMILVGAVSQAYSKSALDEDDPSRVPMRGFYEGDLGITDWWQTGQDDIEKSIKTTIRITEEIRRAKNVILFIGDGMGLSTVSAARIYHAQSRALIGDNASLSFEKFPYLALSKTYNTNSQVPDSAGTATAYLSGYKSKRGTVGLNQNVYRGNCTNNPDNKVFSYLYHAMKENKWTGIVTNTRITHATPAAAYAHVGDRDWESDADRNNHVPEADRDKCPDIAYQLIHNEENKNIKVLLGGGRAKLMTEDQRDPENPIFKGERQDGHDLIQEWIDHKKDMFPDEQEKYSYVTDDEGFKSVNEDETEYLLGLFEADHMNFEYLRNNEPSLAEMTAKAIKILQKSEDGYALLVEGGRIDLAHHANQAAAAMIETVSLSDAVQTAVDMTDAGDTLIVVTADHSHVFTISADAYISNNILGLAKIENKDYTDMELIQINDGKPYLTLGYTNGPGFIYHRTRFGVQEQPRKDLSGDPLVGTAPFVYDTAMLIDSETHGGEDVAIYARGPMSHLFHGVHEQNYIAHVIMYAACIGPNKDLCQDPQYPECNNNS